MLSLAVNIDSRQVSGMVRKLRASLQGAAAARVVAEAGAELTREHLTGLAGKRHRAGMAHNFYLRAADSVVAEPVAGGAEITVPHTGMALRYFGGTVRPSGRVSLVTGRPIRRLAVPIKGSEAEGKTPGDFKGVFVIASKRSGKAVLAGRKAGGMVAVLFRLLKSTTHKPDKGVIPTDAQYRDAAVEALGELLEETSS